MGAKLVLFSSGNAAIHVLLPESKMQRDWLKTKGKHP